jgi:hypothetical protein
MPAGATAIGTPHETLGEFVKRRSEASRDASEPVKAPPAAVTTPKQAERSRIAMRQLMQHHFAARRLDEKRSLFAAKTRPLTPEEQRAISLNEMALGPGITDRSTGPQSPVVPTAGTTPPPA